MTDAYIISVFYIVEHIQQEDYFFFFNLTRAYLYDIVAFFQIVPIFYIIVFLLKIFNISQLFSCRFW